MADRFRPLLLLAVCVCLTVSLGACRSRAENHSQSALESSQADTSVSPDTEADRTPENGENSEFEPVTRDTLVRDVMNHPAFAVSGGPNDPRGHDPGEYGGCPGLVQGHQPG